MGAGGLQVGRQAERELLVSCLRDAVAGRPGALLVSGEPGIGKTSLVAEVTSGPAAEGQQVLWGRCLRFGADSSPYLPFGQVLAQWHRRADEEERRQVLAGAEQLATIAPVLGPGPAVADAARLVPLVATALDRIAACRPLVVVLDDVQWADGTSLDLLAYLVAGFDRGQRLALLLTYRDTELGEGHRLHGWLADVVRMPSVGRLRLQRLGYADAESLVSRLRPDGAGDDLVAQVFARSAGNPYYTELLVRSAAEATVAPGTDGLRHELLSTWHRLTTPTRELLQVLAVGGRPVSGDLLEQLVVGRSGAARDVRACLREASAAGLVTVDADGEAWFHHPLIPEVVSATLGPGARRRLHQEYVAVLEGAPDLLAGSRNARLALHHEGAGDHDAAFTASLLAADEAAAVRGFAEVSEHLQRACRLWDHVAADVRGLAGDRVDLWTRASQAAWSAGDPRLAVEMREDAVARCDPAADAARAVRLRLPLHGWRVDAGLPATGRVEAARSVLELAARHCPGSPEHVRALAMLAKAEDTSVAGDWVHAGRLVDEAVALARDSGSEEALGWALTMRSVVREWPEDFVDGRRALDIALSTGSVRLLAEAARNCSNILDYRGQHTEAVEVLLATYREVLDRGSVFDALACAPWHAAGYLVQLGRWQEARELLRDLLSRRLPDRAAGLSRATAALLAFRVGDLENGRAHLERARELYERPPGFELPLDPLWQVEAHWALGQHREALALTTRLVPIGLDLDPSGLGELLVVAARSAADLSREPGSKSEAVGWFDAIDRAADPENPWFEVASADDLLHPALARLYDAERARCTGTPDEADRWRAAVSACAAAGLTWDEARASYQLARTLGHERGARPELASALRRAVRVAAGLGAGPLLREAEQLARQAHVPLGEPEPPASAPGASGGLPDLTAREREVLAHLVAGRTYAEIAGALFISEKTVSVHVSNLLRKSGTSSRIELAELVGRTAGGQGHVDAAGRAPTPGHRS